MKKVLLIPFLALGLIAAFFLWPIDSAEAKNFAQNSIIIKIKEPFRDKIFENIKFKGNTLFSSLEQLNGSHRVKKMESLSEDKNSPLYGYYQLTFTSSQNVSKLLKEYESNSLIQRAEPDYELGLNLYTPNDPYFSYQWNLDKVNIQEAWAYDNDANPYGGSSSIVVAVIDTGVAYENYGHFKKAPDLANTNFVAGYDYVDSDSHPNDDDGHGTSIAEIIAATTNNSRAIAGLSFNVSIMPVRVIKHNALASAATVAKGIDYARKKGADVINISLGGETSSEVLYDAIKAAYNAGIIIVASTGNDGDPRIYYPAAYPEVIAVGASKENNNLTSFSNYGEGLDLVAPGEQILAEYCTDAPTCSSYQLAYLSGTSQAAPHVSAGAALLLSYGSEASSVKSYLTNSAKDLGVTGYDTTFGYGLLDLNAAFALAQSDIGAPKTIFSTIPRVPDGNNGYFTSYPKVYMSASDENGIKGIYYRVDSGSWLTYSGPFTLQDGQHLVEYYSKDNLGTTEKTKSSFVYVDTTAPTLKITRPYYNQKAYGGVILGRGTYSDATSGLSSFTISGQEVDFEDGSYSELITLEKGINYLEYILKDRAGNTKTLTKKVISYRRSDTAVGLGAGELPRVRIYNSNRSLVGEFIAYTSAYHGGVNIASGDFDNDGTEEIVTAPISGGGPHVRVLTNRAGNFSQFMAYMDSFRGGVNVATGDVDGDGNLEIITGPGAGGGPHVRIFNSQGQVKSQFFAYMDVFKGGVKVASGDVDGDGIAEIITGTGPSGGPQVRIFDFQGQVKGQFMAYADAFRGGINVAAADLNADGTAEIITAPLSDGGPHVRIFDISGQVKGQFFVYAESFRGGLNLSAGDVDNDGTYEIITGAENGFFPEVKIFEMNGAFISNFHGFVSGFRGGVKVTGFN